MNMPLSGTDVQEEDISRKPEDIIKIGTWNVRTMLQEEKLENAKAEMQRYRLDALGVSEIGWSGSGNIKMGEFRIIYSGGDDTGRYGVGLILGPRLCDKVASFNFVSDKLLVVRLNTVVRDVVLVQVYMPISQRPDEEDGVYNALERIIEIEKRNTCIVLMGDWNAVVGEEAVGDTVGKFGLGIRNQRGEKLINFCQRNNFFVGNTWFQHHKRRRYTWINSLDSERYQIDYILMQKRFRYCLKNAKGAPGAEIDSDHKLLVAEVYVNFRYKQRYWTKRSSKCNIKEARTPLID